MCPELLMMSLNVPHIRTLVLQLFGYIKYVEIHTNLQGSFLSFIFRLSFLCKHINSSFFPLLSFLKLKSYPFCEGPCKVRTSETASLENTPVNNNRSSAGGNLEK